jgi:hypothetical protein
MESLLRAAFCNVKCAQLNILCRHGVISYASKAASHGAW